MSAERHYTVAQVAELLQVGRSTVYRWMDAGLLQSVKLSPRVRRISESALREFQEAREKE